MSVTRARQMGIARACEVGEERERGGGRTIEERRQRLRRREVAGNSRKTSAHFFGLSDGIWRHD